MIIIAWNAGQVKGGRTPPSDSQYEARPNADWPAHVILVRMPAQGQKTLKVYVPDENYWDPSLIQ